VTASNDSQVADALLEVEGLSVEFQRGKEWVGVVHDVGFRVARGEVLGLVGESGSGKTVTSLAIMGLLPRGGRVAAGSARFGGLDLLDLAPAKLRQVRGNDVAMVFQDALRCLNPAFTVGDQIAEVVRVHTGASRADAKQRAKQMLELVEISRAEQRLDDYPHMFSGGMSQRVMLAIALACEPKLLFADEPTTALDVTVQSQVLELLKSLQAELGLSVVFVTHDLGVVADLCDRVAVMYAGEVVEAGERDDVFFRPEHPYTSGLLTSLPESEAEERTFAFIPGSVPTPGSWPVGCHFHPRCVHCEPERCAVEPIPLVAGRHARTETRCVRSAELELRGVSASNRS
jgi:oligopeptide/dipeptide ABC transporter ATP-binding protein